MAFTISACICTSISNVSKIGRLMEYVERLRYKQLYLFKKTLIETGQHTMADTVPVRLVQDVQSAVSELPEEQSMPDQRVMVYVFNNLT